MDGDGDGAPHWPLAALRLLPPGHVGSDADEPGELMNRWAVDRLVIATRLNAIAQLAAHRGNDRLPEPHLTPAGLEYQRQLLRQPEFVDVCVHLGWGESRAATLEAVCVALAAGDPDKRAYYVACGDIPADAPDDLSGVDR